MEVFKFYQEFKNGESSDEVDGSVQGVSVCILLETNWLIKKKRKPKFALYDPYLRDKNKNLQFQKFLQFIH